MIPANLVIAATFTTDPDGEQVVNWVMGNATEDEKPRPYMADHAVPVIDELVSVNPVWN